MTESEFLDQAEKILSNSLERLRSEAYKKADEELACCFKVFELAINRVSPEAAQHIKIKYVITENSGNKAIKLLLLFKHAHAGELGTFLLAQNKAYPLGYLAPQAPANQEIRWGQEVYLVDQNAIWQVFLSLFQEQGPLARYFLKLESKT